MGGARARVERGLADPRRLAIRGSAGGYTVLNALIRYPGFFRAGICLFGVTNLFTLAAETHKFEAHYLDTLVGPLPEAAERYRAWSPILHADRIPDPVAIFQGAEDRGVPPSQAEARADALRRRGVPHLDRLYPGEGHGGRRPETLTPFDQEVVGCSHERTTDEPIGPFPGAVSPHRERGKGTARWAPFMAAPSGSPPSRLPCARAPCRRMDRSRASPAP